MLKMIDLFSGIGGFTLASSWTGEIETIAFCEIDPFCQKVLKKHWPDVPIISNIREVTGERIRKIVENAGCEHGARPEVEGELDRQVSCQKNALMPERPVGHDGTGLIDLLSGGFPCQPFSAAGKRKGKADDRYLWPEMLRVIKELKPTWVIGENVAGIISMAQQDSETEVDSKTHPEAEEYENSEADGILWGIIQDLEAIGYEVQPFVIPACAVNAPHRRDRVWVVAYSESNRDRRVAGEICETDGRQNNELRIRLENADCHASDTNRFNGNNAGHGTGKISQQQETEICGCTIADTRRNISQGRGGATYDTVAKYYNAWNEHWYKVALRTCVRGMDDGVSRRVDRVNRLKALGNAIVPQVVYPIFKAIVEIEKL